MPSAESPFKGMVESLRAVYGRPKPPLTSDPLELVFWENAAYLLSDERRQKVFELLRERVGLKPRDILAAKSAALLEIAMLGGMRPEVRVERWLTIGQLDKSEWKTLLGGRWRQRAGRIIVDGVGAGFGGRTLCLRVAGHIAYGTFELAREILRRP